MVDMSFTEDVKAGWEDKPPPSAPSGGGMVMYEITPGIEVGRKLRRTWGAWLCVRGQHEEQRLWEMDKFATANIRPWHCRRCKKVVAWTNAEPPFTVLGEPNAALIAGWDKLHEAALSVAKEVWEQWQNRPKCGLERHPGSGRCTRDPGHTGNHGMEVEPGLVFAPWGGEEIESAR